jgi:hypothetical protein
VATVNAQTGEVTGVSAGTATIRATASDGSGVTADKAVTVTAPPAVKTVAVSTQAGSITAGTAGTATFPVATENIANGAYTVTVANLPAGVSVSGQVTIADGNGTLTLAGNTSTTAGVTNTLTLTIDGATSGAFTLTIDAAAAEKTVSVGTPSGTMTVGVAGTTTYTVTTTGIANGTYPATIPSLPTGISIQGGAVVINGNTGTLTLTGTPTVHGFFNSLRLTIDGTQSGTFTLSIDAATGEPDPNPTLPGDYGLNEL